MGTRIGHSVNKDVPDFGIAWLRFAFAVFVLLHSEYIVLWIEDRVGRGSREQGVSRYYQCASPPARSANESDGIIFWSRPVDVTCGSSKSQHRDVDVDHHASLVSHRQ
jgi:hypothetical protein